MPISGKTSSRTKLRPYRNIALLVFGLLTAAPLFAGLIYALLFSLGLAGTLGEGITPAHWQQALSARETWVSFLFSGWTALASIFLATALALFYTLNYRIGLSGKLSWLPYIPLAVPAIVAGFFSFLLLSDGGLISRLAWQAGLIPDAAAFPDLVNDPWGAGIILTHTMMAWPFLLLVFLNLYQSERLDLLSQLAVSLGASPKQVARKVQLPILLQKASPTLILYFIFVLGSYEIPLILGRQSPQMVSVLIIRKFRRFELLDKPQAFAIAILYTLITLALVFLLLRAKRTEAPVIRNKD
jgi:putative spermidine/putrescine transport system permease protein